MFKKVLVATVVQLLFPLRVMYKKDTIKTLIVADAARYLGRENITYQDVAELFIKKHAFRNIVYFRAQRSGLRGVNLLKFLFPPVHSIEIGGDIGGGLYIPHNSAVIAVEKAGKNLTILPGVVIGKKAKQDTMRTNPILGDNCTCCANSTLFGPVTLGDNVIIGAGCVVLEDVPDNMVVVTDNKNRMFERKASKNQSYG